MAAAAPPGIITQVSQNQQSSPSTPLKGRRRRLGLFSCCSPKSSRQDRQQQNGNAPWSAQYGDPGRDLLPAIVKEDSGKKCLVIDLDETLVHSSFKPVAQADYVVPIEIDGIIHQVYVCKRPHVDLFLQRVGELYELVLFTASLSKYADPVSDLLDPNRLFRHRLFREHCVQHRGNYVKDLGRLGRDLSQVIILDNSPVSYIFNPTNAVPIESWFDSPDDTDLLDLIPIFEDLAQVPDVQAALKVRAQAAPTYNISI